MRSQPSGCEESLFCTIDRPIEQKRVLIPLLKTQDMTRTAAGECSLDAKVSHSFGKFEVTNWVMTFKAFAN